MLYVCFHVYESEYICHGDCRDSTAVGILPSILFERWSFVYHFTVRLMSFPVDSSIHLHMTIGYWDCRGVLLYLALHGSPSALSTKPSPQTLRASFRKRISDTVEQGRR